MSRKGSLYSLYCSDIQFIYFKYSYHKTKTYQVVNLGKSSYSKLGVVTNTLVDDVVKSGAINPDSLSLYTC